MTTSKAEAQRYLENIANAQQMTTREFIAWLRHMADYIEGSLNEDPTDWQDEQNLYEWLNEAVALP